MVGTRGKSKLSSKEKMGEEFRRLFKGYGYSERVTSFKSNGWPFVDPTTHTCTAEELAMAGFMWEEGGGTCFACDVRITIEDCVPDAIPWELHMKKSPNCRYLKLGKRQLPRDYKFNDLVKILVMKIENMLEESVLEAEQKVRSVIAGDPADR